MTRGATFSDAFWESDIIGTFGWDTVCRRMKDGKKVCSEVAHYLRDRAKAEQDYCKTLLNLTRKADGKEEIGVLGQSWQVLKAQTERIANIHDDAGQLFARMAEEMNQFHDEQKRQKQAIEDNVKKYIQSKKNDYSKAMSLKKSYEQKCMDYNNAEETYMTMKQSVTTKVNDLQKAQNKLEKALDVRNNADTAYKSGLDSLEACRSNWEEQTERAFKQFEVLEVNRIDMIRNMMWKVTNVDSDACVRHDECSEKVRVVLENCDVDDDIQTFIEKNKTGSKRPDPVLYEDYYGNSKDNNSPRPQSRRPQMRAPAPPPGGKPQNSFDDGVYAYVDSSATTFPSKVLLTVVREHRPRRPHELEVNVGDKLERMDANINDGMIKVKLVGNSVSRVGFVPETCVSQNSYVNYA